MHKFQKGSQPRFHKHGAAVFPQYALHLRKSLSQIFRQSWQMMQTDLHDKNILGAIGKRKLTAIADNTFCRPAILCDQPGRQVHAFEAREAETLESDQAVSSPAKEFDDFGVARPLRSAQSSEAFEKLSNLLFR